MTNADGHAVREMPRDQWTPPPLWLVPRDWPGERVYVLCGGASVKAQIPQIAKLKGRIIAVKHGVLIRPDAQVAFFAGERADEIAPPLIKAFHGRYLVVRGRGHRVFPPHAKRVFRPKTHERWMVEDRTSVAGFDAGTSAINLAIHFGAAEIVMLGYDMIGGRWFHGMVDHYLPHPPESAFKQHMSVLPALAEHARELGVRIVNCSPVSRVDCFERQPLEAML